MKKVFPENAFGKIFRLIVEKNILSLDSLKREIERFEPESLFKASDGRNVLTKSRLNKANSDFKPVLIAIHYLSDLGKVRKAFELLRKTKKENDYKKVIETFRDFFNHCSALVNTDIPLLKHLALLTGFMVASVIYSVDSVLVSSNSFDVLEVLKHRAFDFVLKFPFSAASF